MIARLVVATILAVCLAELLKPVGMRWRWSAPRAFGVSFLVAVVVALLVNAVVFG